VKQRQCAATAGPWVALIFKTLEWTSINRFTKFGSGSQKSGPWTRTKKTKFVKKIT
jgi:hypothetical protein